LLGSTWNRARCWLSLTRMAPVFYT
jgi:hypothetical protein